MIWGAMFLALRWGQWCYFPYEMGNDVWKLKTDYSDLSPSMFSGSGGPSRDGGGGNEEDKMETEEEVMETYKCHLS